VKKPAWSYSALTAFETCPRRYHLTRVAKTVPDPPGEAALWGTEVHKHLELRAKDSTPLPETLKYLEPMMAKILDKPHDELYVEKQYCLNADMQPVAWFAKDAWCRGVVDLGLRKGKKVLVLDHKTGKRKPDSDQLQLFAALVMTEDKAIDAVTTGFLWLKDRKIDREQFTRDDIPTIWQNFIPRVRRLESAFEKDRWEAKPSGLCKNWCPCTTCEFCGAKK
jgi:hypothetical protein